MNGFELTARIVDSLAWPVVVGILVVLLRKQIGTFLGAITARMAYLKKASYRDLSLEFDEGLETAEESVSAVVHPSTSEAKVALGQPTVTVEPPARQAAELERQEFERLALVADASPRAAILEAFIGVEAALLDAAIAHGWQGKPGPGSGFLDAERYLAERLPLGSQFRQALKKLRQLRNQAAHAPDFEPELGQAVAYIDTARSYVQYLRGVEQAPDIGDGDT